MIVSVGLEDTTVSVGEASEGPDKVAVLVQKVDAEPSRIVLDLQMVPQVMSMLEMYMSQFTPASDEG